MIMRRRDISGQTLIIKSRMFLSSVPLLLYRLVLLLPCSFLTNQIQGVSGKKWGQFEFHINDSHYMQMQTVSNSAVKAKYTCTSCHFPKQVIVKWYNHECRWNSVFILKVYLFCIIIHMYILIMRMSSFPVIILKAHNHDIFYICLTV